MSSIKIGITRSGNSVQISLQCESEHDAIEAYDRLAEGAKKGEVTIALKTTKAEPIVAHDQPTGVQL
jgi:hypothetical protein